MADETNEQRKEIEKYFEQLSPEERRQRIYLQPAFRDAYNEITEAHRQVPIPRYFWEKWVPVLGPVAATLYMKLRQYCYYNPETGERRDYCWPKQDTLASDIGVRDRKTIRKALTILEVFGFIKRERTYYVDQGTGRPHQGTDRYLIYFEIPLVTPDAVELLIRQSAASVQEPAPYGGKKSPHKPKPVEKQPYEGKISPHGAGDKIPTNKYLEQVLRERNVGSQTQDEPTDAPDFTAPTIVLPSTERVTRSRGTRRLRTERKRLGDVLPEITTSPAKRDELLRVEDLAGQMLEQLGDSRSRPFYRMVARRFLAAGLEQLVYQTLSEVKEGHRAGTLRNPAAVFTARVKELAAAQGIDL